MRRVALAIALTVVATGAAIAVGLDDKIELGGFHPGLTLDEADAHAGAKGERYCKTWEPNPTIHWCKWTYSDATQHVEIRYGGDGVIHGIDRRVPLPPDMSDEEALRQAAIKLKRYGPPSRDVIPGNLHWGCNGDDCSGRRMIRVWIMEGHAGFFGGQRHLAIGWGNRIRSQKNQERFQRESSEWDKAQEKEKFGNKSPLKL